MQSCHKHSNLSSPNNIENPSTNDMNYIVEPKKLILPTLMNYVEKNNSNSKVLIPPTTTQKINNSHVSTECKRGRSPYLNEIDDFDLCQIEIIELIKMTATNAIEKRIDHEFSEVARQFLRKRVPKTQFDVL